MILDWADLTLLKRLTPFGLSSQHRLQHLAARIARHRLRSDGDELRNFEIGKLLAREGDKIGHVNALSRTWHDHRSYLLSHHRIRYSDHCYFEYRGVRGKRILHLDAIDVLAAAADHVLLPIYYLHEALVIDSSHVAGMEPTVYECFGRCLGFVPIALNHIRAAHQQFPRSGGEILLEEIKIHYRRTEAHRLRPRMRIFVR